MRSLISLLMQSLGIEALEKVVVVIFLFIGAASLAYIHMCCELINRLKPIPAKTQKNLCCATSFGTPTQTVDRLRHYVPNQMHLSKEA
jgi:hypothetical protein